MDSKDEDIEQDGLVDKMRAYANDVTNIATAEQRSALITLAFALEQAITDPTWPVPQIVNRWAAARRYWCNLTGEPFTVIVV